MPSDDRPTLDATVPYAVPTMPEKAPARAPHDTTCLSRDDDGCTCDSPEYNLQMSERYAFLLHAHATNLAASLARVMQERDTWRVRAEQHTPTLITDAMVDAAELALPAREPPEWSDVIDYRRRIVRDLLTAALVTARDAEGTV